MNNIYDLAFFRCHQFPQRSLFWAGFEFPLCMRDTGITIGFLVGLLALYLAKNYKSRNIDPRTLLLLLPMAVDGGFQALGFWQSNFFSRYLSGMLTGLLMAIVFFGIFHKKVQESVPQKRTLIYFTLISIPLFLGYWAIYAGMNIGIVGDFLFWLIVWSVPFIYFAVGIGILVAAWQIFETITDKMDTALRK